MKLFYTAMMKEMKDNFKESGEDSLEVFLKEKELEYKSKYKLSNLMFYFSVTKLLENEKIKSKHFKDLFVFYQGQEICFSGFSRKSSK